MAAAWGAMGTTLAKDSRTRVWFSGVMSGWFQHVAVRYVASFPHPGDPVDGMIASTEKRDRTLTHAAIIIVAGILATTLAQTQVLARLPLQNLLKNELHLDRSSNAAFFFWAALAWYLKPLAGIMTDAYPLFGTRRRNYLLLSSILAAAGWIALAVTPHGYGDLLSVVIV